MKIISFAFVILVSSMSMAANFKCFAPKNNHNAFLAGGYALITVDSKSLRFQQFSDFSGVSELLRDYSYEFKGIAGGNSKVTGMMKFNLVKENISYGDSLETLYVAQSLSRGIQGTLIFSGQGYSWDWNFCKPLSPTI
jgi:hypothetical protein